jgi:hypothetical protein
MKASQGNTNKNLLPVPCLKFVYDLPTGEAGVGGGLAGPGLEAVGGRL